MLLADVRSVGVQGDGRTYGHPDRAAPGLQRGRDDRRLDPRPVRRPGSHLHRITNEVPDVNRVVLDVTSKPPGTINGSEPSGSAQLEVAGRGVERSPDPS